MILSKVHFFALVLVFSLTSTGFTSPNSTTNYFDQDPEVMTAGLFKIQTRLDAVLDNFDFDFKCSISSFRLVRVTKSSDPIIIENQGSDFTPATLRSIKMAKSGDYYFFENIRAKCVGDNGTRKLAAITVKVN